MEPNNTFPGAEQNNPVTGTGTAQPTGYGTAPQPTQQQPYNPYAAPSAPMYAPPASYGATYPQTAAYQTPAYTAAVNPNKKSAGKIIAIIFGVLLTIVGAFLTLAIVAYYVDYLNTYREAYIDIPTIIIVLFPLILGIVLIVFGCKKKKNAAVVTPAQGYYGTSAPVIPQPVQNAAPVVPQPVQNTAPAAAEAASASTADSVPTIASVVAGTVGAVTASAATDTTADATATVMDTTPDASALPTTAATAPAYAYAPNTAPVLEDETDKMRKKAARTQALSALGVIVLMWVVLLAFDRLFYWLLIFPFILSFRAIRANVKSISGWAAMLLSCFSVVLMVFLLFMANQA